MPGCLLIDIDSTIPNLALMKISAYKKSKGIPCGFNIEDPNEIYASIIFRKNKHKADGLKYLYPNAKIDIGGPGYDLNKKLPDEIENTPPDYTLYPNMDYDLGFTTRGCNRHCYFCIVHDKEGSFKINQHPREFHKEGHKKIVLMDNNILFNKMWFMTVTSWILHQDMKVDFNQGLDIRLIDDDIAKRLAELKPIKYWRFAYDSIDYTYEVITGINCLKKAGVDVRHKSLWYVYVDDDRYFNDALTRCRILRENGALPYIMLNQDMKRTQRITNLKRWTRPWIFYSVDFDDYKKESCDKSVNLHKNLGGFVEISDS